MSLELLETRVPERCIVLSAVTWLQFETIEAAFENVPGVKFTYLDGTLEIITLVQSMKKPRVPLAYLLKLT